MSVANLNAYALQKGLSKTFEQMTQGEQTMLRYQYIMSATADAQGDFSRTSDGYANSLRTLETNLESIKTKLGEVLIDKVSEAVSWVNTLLTDLQGKGERTVLDDFAEIDLNTNAKLQEIENTKTKTQELLDLLDKAYGNGDNNENGESNAAVVAGLGVKSEETQTFLEGLGFTTEEINRKSENWLETCRRLVKTLPGLANIINVETGEVKGGRAAVEEYVNAWAEGQKKLALMNAQAQRKSALAEKYQDLPGLEVDKMLLEDRVKKARAQLDRIAKQYGFSPDENGRYEFGGLLYDPNAAIVAQEQDYYDTLVGNYEDAVKKWEKQNKAYQDALKIIEDGERVIQETYGDVEDVVDESEKFWTDNAENAKTAVANMSDAMTKLDDYVTGVRTSVEKAVDSVVSGFTRVESPMQNLQEQINELTLAYSRGEIEQDEYEKKTYELTRSMDKQGLTAKGMIDNLKSQSAFMKEYLRNLGEARRLGVSDAVLAELSDGSTESADRLNALVHASDAEIGEINELYAEVQTGKKNLTDTLTQQTLTADDVYKSLADTAKEAVAALDMGQEAADNSGKTVQGLAKGISDNVDSVQSAVDAILDQLNRLNGWGIDIDFGGFGNIHFTSNATNDTSADAVGLMGWDYVPRDNFIIRAHEGETLLNAEEARIWRNFKANGISSDDIEALSGSIGDRVRPGGNVYLDGRVVGQVLSEQQGKSYRALQRSGWQGG